MMRLNKTASVLFASFTLSLLVLLPGCANVGKLATASGRPEVSIPNMTPQKVMDGLAAWLPAHGETIVETGEYTISAIFTRDSGIWRAPSRSTFTIAQNGTNVSLYEATFPISGDMEYKRQEDYEVMQNELTQIAEFIKGR
jgi:hypothetical protein